MKRPLLQLCLPLIALALAVACDSGGRVNTPPLQSAVAEERREMASGTYVLGSSVSPEGSIPKDAAGETFVRGGDVFLSVAVAGATREQEVKVEWIDARGHVIRREKRIVPETARYATFSAGPTDRLNPGTYRVAVIIDGRRVNDQQFSVA